MVMVSVDLCLSDETAGVSLLAALIFLSLWIRGQQDRGMTLPQYSQRSKLITVERPSNGSEVAGMLEHALI